MLERASSPITDCALYRAAVVRLHCLSLSSFLQSEPLESSELVHSSGGVPNQPPAERRAWRAAGTLEFNKGHSGGCQGVQAAASSRKSASADVAIGEEEFF